MKKWAISALLFMMLNGTVIIFQKYISVLGLANYTGVYLGISYIIGAAVCFVITAAGNHEVRLKSLVFGIAGGILSYTGCYFYIHAMGAFPSSVIVPVYSCCSIVMVTAGSVVIFKEKIGKRQIAAIIAGILAVIALCI